MKGISKVFGLVFIALCAVQLLPAEGGKQLPLNVRYGGAQPALREKVEVAQRTIDKPGLTLIVDPKEAEIYVDQVLAGKGPSLAVAAEPGSHYVVVRAAGYRDFEQWVDVPAKGGIELKLSLAQKSGRLYIACNVNTELLIYIDDGIYLRSVVGAEDYLVLAEGNHKITINASYYEAFSGIVTIEDGKETRLSVELASVKALVYISTAQCAYAPGTSFFIRSNTPGKIKLTVLNKNGAIVFSRDSEEIIFSLTIDWNRKDRDGKELPPDTYTARVEMSSSIDGAGSAETEISFSITANDSYFAPTGSLLFGSPGLPNCPVVSGYALKGLELMVISAMNLRVSGQPLITGLQLRWGVVDWLEIDLLGAFCLWDFSNPYLKGSLFATASVMRPTIDIPFGFSVWAGLGGGMGNIPWLSGLEDGARCGITLTYQSATLFSLSLSPSFFIEAGNSGNYMAKLGLSFDTIGNGVLCGYGFSISQKGNFSGLTELPHVAFDVFFSFGPYSPVYFGISWEIWDWDQFTNTLNGKIPSYPGTINFYFSTGIRPGSGI